MPQIGSNNRSDFTSHDRITKLVEEIIALHKLITNTKIPHEKESLQRQIDSTDKQIDQLVYQIYGLTDEEIRIVEEIH